MTLSPEAARKLFKKEKSSYIFLGPYLEIRLPKADFTSGMAKEFSNSVECVAIFTDCRVSNNSDGSSYNDFKFISAGSIETIPSKMVTEGDNIVMCYEAGDTFILSDRQIVDWRAASVINKNLFGGKLDTIPLMNIAKLTIDAFVSNDVSTGLPASYIEGYIALSYRDPKNLQKEMRFRKDLDLMTTEGVFIPLKQLPAYSSDAGSLMFEGVHASLATRISSKGKGVNKSVSLDEAIIRSAPEKDETHVYE